MKSAVKWIKLKVFSICSIFVVLPIFANVSLAADSPSGQSSSSAVKAAPAKPVSSKNSASKTSESKAAEAKAAEAKAAEAKAAEEKVKAEEVRAEEVRAAETLAAQSRSDSYKATYDKIFVILKSYNEKGLKPDDQDSIEAAVRDSRYELRALERKLTPPVLDVDRAKVKLLTALIAAQLDFLDSTEKYSPLLKERKRLGNVITELTRASLLKCSTVACVNIYQNKALEVSEADDRVAAQSKIVISKMVDATRLSSDLSKEATEAWAY